MNCAYNTGIQCRYCGFSSRCEIYKENVELKNRDCWKTCEYANPKSELIGQHIKDVQDIAKAKELLERCYDNYVYLEPLRSEIEQFLKSSEVNNALS